MLLTAKLLAVLLLSLILARRARARREWRRSIVPVTGLGAR